METRQIALFLYPCYIIWHLFVIPPPLKCLNVSNVFNVSNVSKIKYFEWYKVSFLLQQLSVLSRSFAKMNFLNLSNLIPGKAASVNFLQQRGMLHNPRYCSNDHAMTLELRDKGDRWRCHHRGCR